MNECPTLVRIGTPPCSRITSGTAREQMRLCRIVAPGWARRTVVASSAVVVDPDSPRPASSTTNTRSASPSKARPTSNAAGDHPGLQIALVGGLQRVGGMVRERAVELAVHHLERRAAASARTPPARPGRPSRWRCRRRPGSGRSAADVDERHDVVGERRSSRLRCDSDPADGAGSGPRAVEHRLGRRLDLEQAGVHRRPAARPTGRA